MIKTCTLDESLPLADGLCPPVDLAGASENPDARLVVHGADGRVHGFCALWWKETPEIEGRHIGTIGGFAATGPGATKALLDAACERLEGIGCQIAVGPMNGNTWRRHRFVIASDQRGPFLLEPRNPEKDSDWWRFAGFDILSQYSSSVLELATAADAVPPEIVARLEREIDIRPLNPDRFTDDLKALHSISLRSFSGNFLYTPLPQESFLTQYESVRNHIDPRLVWIAEHQGEPIGFVFGIADLEAAQRGEPPALIVKTLAVVPERRVAGLGSHLVDRLHEQGRALGFREAIHALQHESNSSRKITGRHGGRIFRRYALFHRTLHP